MVELRWTIPNDEFNAEKIQNPSVADIKAWMGKLDDGWWSSFYVIDQKKNSLTVINASDDRVMVTFRGMGSKVATLCDPEYLDSSDTIDAIGDPDGSPYMFYATVQKNVAVDVVAYFVQHSLLPKDHVWGAYGGSVDEFIG